MLNYFLVGTFTCHFW